jgi:small-conductance mechanosensitive channel
MEAFWTDLVEFFQGTRIDAIIRALLTIAIGLLIAKLLSGGLVKLFQRQTDAHESMLLRRFSFYFVSAIFVISALVELGFNFSVLLGAAGILTIALGFASQTSASNLISGLFLLGEKAFVVGDVIRIGTTTGEVLSVDLLSVKLRTFDNLFVRIANENLIKSEIINLTRFPIRRIDMQIGVAYKEDLKTVFEILEKVADDNPMCLDEPRPMIIFQGYGDSSLNMQFSVWTSVPNFIKARTALYLEIKKTFDEHGIEIPFPHRTLYTGSETLPFKVQVVAGVDPDGSSDTD